MKLTRKPSFLLLACLSMSLAGCGTIYNIYNSDSSSKKEESLPYNKKTGSIILDSAFERGFRLNKNKDASAPDFSLLNYDGKAATGICEWNLFQNNRADEFDLSKVSCSKSGNTYTYSNDARGFSVNTVEKTISFKLNSGKEYKSLYGSAKNKDVSKASQFILEQNLYNDSEKKQFPITCAEKLTVSFNLLIDKCTFDGDELSDTEKITDLNLCEIYMNIYLADSNTNSATKDSSKKIKLVLPIFNTLSSIVESSFVKGSEPVYTVSTRDVMPVDNEGTKVGVNYNVNYNVVPAIKDAFNGLRETLFAGCNYEKLELYSFNIVASAPGAFNLSYTINNFDIISAI